VRVPQSSNVVCDQIISFPRLAREGEKPVLFRRVEIWTRRKRRPSYSSRTCWPSRDDHCGHLQGPLGSELFFKALKQTLKSRPLWEPAPMPVRTQVWTALIAMLVLKYLQLKSTFSWSLSTPGKLCCVSNSSSIAICGCGWMILFSPRRLWRMHDDAEQWESM